MLLDQDRNVGDYLVRNVSAGGALLTDGPSRAEGAPVTLRLELSGLPPLRLSGIVARHEAMLHGGAALGVAFRRVPSDAEDLLQEAVLRSLEHRYAPSVLLVDGDIRCLARLLSDLDALDRRSILARTPLEVIRWLTDLDTVVEAVIVAQALPTGDGLQLLRLVARQFEPIRRILLVGQHDVTGRRGGPRHHSVHATLSKPWRRDQLEAALGPNRPRPLV